MCGESQHHVSLIRFPIFWGLVMRGFASPPTSSLVAAQSSECRRFAEPRSMWATLLRFVFMSLVVTFHAKRRPSVEMPKRFCRKGRAE
eukprot:s4056_g3.t1